MEEIKYKALKIVIEHDDMEFVENPRSECDNLGIMVCFHKRFNLGDDVKTHGLKCDDFNGWDDLQDHIESELNAICILPIYLYDHSGITISTKPFSCSWDSGQIGFIYTTQERWKIFMGDKEIDPDKLEQFLIGEVETYDSYLQGEVYRYKIITPWDEEVDSCGGFFGSNHEENGLREYAQNAVDAWLDETGEEQEFSFKWYKTYESSGSSKIKAHNKLEAYSKAMEMMDSFKGELNLCPEHNEIVLE